MLCHAAPCVTPRLKQHSEACFLQDLLRDAEARFATAKASADEALTMKASGGIALDLEESSREGEIALPSRIYEQQHFVFGLCGNVVLDITLLGACKGLRQMHWEYLTTRKVRCNKGIVLEL